MNKTEAKLFKAQIKEASGLLGRLRNEYPLNYIDLSGILDQLGELVWEMRESSGLDKNISLMLEELQSL